MIDHLTVLVSDFERSLAFYTAALAPLGYAVVMHFTLPDAPDPRLAQSAGLGAEGKPDFWLRPSAGPLAPTHIAFASPDRKSVDAFYAAAMAAGARDNGPPGLRPEQARGGERREQHAEKAGQRGPQARAPGALPEGLERGRGRPVLQRRLLEVLEPVQARGEPVAAGDHLARDLGVAALVGVEQVALAEIGEPGEGEDEQ